MNATVAREHVRVARALREMPQTKELFRIGQFSYSKVRELSRLVGVVDEAELCELALELTASQLARTVSSFRLAAGSRIRALPERRYCSQVIEGGMVTDQRRAARRAGRADQCRGGGGCPGGDR
jgi:hypothetical protein